MQGEAADRTGKATRPWHADPLLLVGGLAGWLAFGWVTLRYLGLSRDLWQQQPLFIHYDWHAYVAGAHQLVDRTLYREPLTLGDVPLPIDAFNMPPLAAAEALPFVVLGLLAGGLAWQGIGALGVAFAASVLASFWTGPVVRALALAGVGIGAVMLVDHVAVPDELSYWWGLTLGTNNHLVLGLLAGFVLALRTGLARVAGLVLGIAIATKLWPLLVGAALVRNREWTALRWAAGACVVQALLFAAWLGPDVAPAFVRSILASDPEPQWVIGVSALREVLPWWPAWAGWAVAALLLALLLWPPVRGTAAIGVSMLAGLAVITNLWGHYLPTILFAFGLIAAGIWAGADQRMKASLDARSAHTPPATRNGPNGM